MTAVLRVSSRPAQQQAGGQGRPEQRRRIRHDDYGRQQHLAAKRGNQPGRDTGLHPALLAGESAFERHPVSERGQRGCGESARQLRTEGGRSRETNEQGLQRGVAHRPITIARLQRLQGRGENPSRAVEVMEGVLAVQAIEPGHADDEPAGCQRQQKKPQWRLDRHSQTPAPGGAVGRP